MTLKMSDINFDIKVDAAPPEISVINDWRLFAAEHVAKETKAARKFSLTAAAFGMLFVLVVYLLAEFTDLFEASIGDFSSFILIVVGFGSVATVGRLVEVKYSNVTYIDDYLRECLEDITPDSNLNRDLVEYAKDVPEIRAYIARVNKVGRPLIYQEYRAFEDYYERYETIVAAREIKAINDAAQPNLTNQTETTAQQRRVSIQ
jgi:hypothetical protein